MNLHSLGEPRCTLRIPKAADWCSQNERLHWAERAKRKQLWRDMTLWQCAAQHFPRNQAPAIVVPVFVFDTVRRRDRGNFTATTKVIIDALCTGPRPPHGWGAWPDDDDRYLEERMPVLHAATNLTPGVVIRVYDR